MANNAANVLSDMEHTVRFSMQDLGTCSCNTSTRFLHAVVLTPVADPSGLVALILLTSPAAQLKIQQMASEAIGSLLQKLQESASPHSDPHKPLHIPGLQGIRKH